MQFILPCLSVKIVLELKGCFRVLSNGRAVKKKEKRKTVYLKIIFQRTKMFQNSYINFLYFQHLVFTVPDTWRKVIVHQFGVTWVQHISEVTYSYSFKYLYTGIFTKECESKTTKICEFAINYHLMNDIINIKTMYT